MLGGGGLTLIGLRRRSLGGALAAASGAALVYRGVSGHCPIYRTLGVSSSRGDRGVTVYRAVTIRRSPAEIYRRVRDFTLLPTLFDRLDQVEPVDDRAYRWHYRAGRVTAEGTIDIIADLPDRRIAWASRRDGRVRADGDIKLVVAPGNRGTEVHVELDLVVPGAGAAVVAPLVARLARRQLAEALRRLKRLIETSAIPTARMRADRFGAGAEPPAGGRGLAEVSP
jgi:uncharacterized membrane protein